MDYHIDMAPFRICVLVALAVFQPVVVQAQNICGMSIEDWCTSPTQSACGRHMNEADCRADTECAAVPYSGESAIACHWDERGFADNCPAVGCQDRKK